MRPLTIAAVVATLAALAAAPPGLAAVSSEQAVAFLNQQRAANGIPGDLVNRPDWAAGCAKHNFYMRSTGYFGHSEDTESPYYTQEGSEAGAASVLSGGDGYLSSGKNPWEWAPIHLYAMLNPANASAGYSANDGYACMRVYGDERAEPAEPQFFSYPGPGAQGIYPAEYAGESPYTPQQVAGIPAGQLTGTNILLFSSLQTYGVKAESFSLSGPGGPVAVRMVDTSTSNAVGSGFWFRGGGVLVPEQPLAEQSTYRVQVKWRNLGYVEPGSPEFVSSPSRDTAFFTQEFEFTTGADVLEVPPEQPRPREPSLSLRLLGRSGALLRFRLVAGRVLRGQRARLAVLRQERGCGPRFASSGGRCGWRTVGRRQVSALRLRRAQVVKVPAPTRWQKLTVKVRTRPFEIGEVRFASAVDGMTIRG
jgi:hypothetical protein